jgi:hypothetical protein
MRITRAVIILVLPLLLSGCLRIEGDIKSGADARVTGVLEYGINKSLTQISGETWTLEKLQSSDEAKDVQSICADGIWTENSQEFVLTCNFNSSQLSDPDLYFKIVDNKIEFHYAQNMDSDGESIELGTVSIKITFPGDIITIRENKSGTVSKSGNNQVTLKAAGTAKIDVTVTSSCGTTCGISSSVGTNGKPYVVAPKTTGGLITENLRFTKANSPYTLTSTLQVPKELSVIVDEGVEITYGGPRYGAKGSTTKFDQEVMFYVHGNIDFKGTDANPINLTGKPRHYFMVEGSKETANILVNGVIFKGGERLVYGSGYAHFSLKNSIIFNVPEFLYIWYPTKPLVIEGNIFSKSGGMSIGFDGRASSGKPITPQVTVRNNFFVGPSTTDYWVESWAAYGSTLNVTSNSFTEGPYTAVAVRKGSDSASLNASGNFWGTTDQIKIAEMVKDSKDGLDFQTIIKTDNPLTSFPDTLLSVKAFTLFAANAVEEAEKANSEAIKAAEEKIAAATTKKTRSKVTTTSKETTIVCLKGKSKLKVIGVKPVCPSGYKKTK